MRSLKSRDQFRKASNRVIWITVIYQEVYKTTPFAIDITMKSSISWSHVPLPSATTERQIDHLDFEVISQRTGLVERTCRSIITRCLANWHKNRDPPEWIAYDDGFIPDIFALLGNILPQTRSGRPMKVKDGSPEPAEVSNQLHL
jgi:hypothetical protein